MYYLKKVDYKRFRHHRSYRTASCVMLEINKHYLYKKLMVFVFHGDVFHLSRLCNNEQSLIEVYNIQDNPSKIVCEIVVDETVFVKIYDRNFIEHINDIVQIETNNQEITHENVDYVFEKNKWLLSLTVKNNMIIMRVDDENDTFDGQYLYHERLFVNKRLIDIQHTFNRKNGQQDQESMYKE